MEKILIIKKEEVHGITVFHLSGWLDATGEETLLAAARDSHSAGARHLLLDLSGVETLTSAGMRAMHKVYKLYTPVEERMKLIRVKICNAPVHVNNILGATGFLLNIPNFPTLQAAIDSFE